MYKKLLLAAIAAGSFALTGCASDGASAGAEGGADVFGAPIYLRGEMNDWNAQPQYLIKKVSDGVYVATAELKVDWAPYKFKFADAGWSAGTNFGYRDQPGVYEMGGEPVALNPKSVFEEVKVTPDADGEYDFYIDVTGDVPVTYVKKH
ncbi:MAG: pullulanase [Ruminobacter sp.]|uniref:pullulanase n=1 Tax=Ruminobacter sp. TaxID=2774296 RepID=UPI001B3FC21D|nr:pullulanase [Ruminobacter sp.]MBP3749307.1 pullulanase [Ruminobacter sp.]